MQANLIEDDHERQRLLDELSDQYRSVDPDENRVRGHLDKARHNLDLIAELKETKFDDWQLIAAYYAVHHAALALLQDKGITTKNHTVTYCLLINHYHKDQTTLTQDELETYHQAYLSYDEAQTYPITKQRREQASYTTTRTYTDTTINTTQQKAIDFVNKAQTILNS
jgi:uncharacterized protein (UPF0332 family)